MPNTSPCAVRVPQKSAHKFAPKIRSQFAPEICPLVAPRIPHYRQRHLVLFLPFNQDQLTQASSEGDIAPPTWHVRDF